MKTRFAKFVDGTFGFFLMFLAAFAVLCYFIPKPFAALTALSFASALFLIFGFRERANGEKLRLSRAADAMFFDFMFEASAAPARLLKKGLCSRGKEATVRGNALYLDGTAAFFCFDAPPTQNELARDLAKAKRYGANKILEFSKLPLPAFPQINGYTVKPIIGDDVYKLFASLDCLPKRKFEEKPRRRFAALLSALSKDRIPRYLLLAGGLTAVTLFTQSIATTVCAAIATALLVASIIYTAVKTKKHGAS